jgi:hypothetical protein
MDCRRCSDCLDLDHHWMPNGDFGNEGDPERPDATGNEYVCKHCDAVGDECPDCDAPPEDLDWDNYLTDCDRCCGRGVAVAEPITFAALQIQTSQEES